MPATDLFSRPDPSLFSQSPPASGPENDTSGVGLSSDSFQRWKGYLEEVKAPRQVKKNVRRLEEGEVQVVIAGQQPGALGGPLYTYYKAASAVAVASRLSASGTPAIPVFWNHSDDHDYSEIDRTYFLDRENEIRDVSLGLDHQETGHIGSLNRPDLVDSLLEQCRNILRDTEFRDPVLDRLGSTKHPRPASWFSGILMDWFGEEGLVPFEPALARGDEKDLIHTHLDSVQEHNRILSERSEAFENEGYAPPLSSIEGPDLFCIEDGKRYRPGSDQNDREEWRRRVEGEAPVISPGVSLRPLIQDSLFPVSVSVTGPSETSYLAQMAPLYDLYEVSQPRILPRMSASIIESKVEKVMEKFGMDEETFFSIPERKDAYLEKVIPGDVPETLDRYQERLQEWLSDLREEAVSLDDNLAGPHGKTKGHMLEAFGRFREKAKEARRKQEEVGENQFQKLEHNLFPRGKVQERCISPWHYICLYGSEFEDEMLDRARHVIRTDPFRHRLFYI